MRERMKKIRLKLLVASHMLMMTVFQLSPLSVCAAPNANKTEATGADAVTSSLGGFNGVLEAILTSFGSFVFLWGIFELGTCLQSPNGSEQTQAFRRIAGGLIMSVGPAIAKGLLA